MLSRRYVVNVMKILLCNLTDANIYREKKNQGTNMKYRSFKIHHSVAFPTVYVPAYPPYILCDIVEVLRLRNKAVIDAGSSSALMLGAGKLSSPVACLWPRHFS